MISRRSVLARAGLAMGAVASHFERAAAESPGPTRVAAAADLHTALLDLVRDDALRGAPPFVVSFGSTGNLTRQIEQGAPFELFFSADESYPMRLVKAGLTDGDGAPYARGQLALAVGAGASVGAEPRLAGLAEALAKGAIRRIAIANPEHAPYGRLAILALERAGLLEAARPRLVHGENVAQALQMVLSGGAEVGLVAWSLVHASRPAALTSVIVDHQVAPPLVQRMVLMKGARSLARRLYEHVLSPAGKATLARHGFLPAQAA